MFALGNKRIKMGEESLLTGLRDVEFGMKG